MKIFDNKRDDKRTALAFDIAMYVVGLAMVVGGIMLYGPHPVRGAALTMVSVALMFPLINFDPRSIREEDEEDF